MQPNHRFFLKRKSYSLGVAAGVTGKGNMATVDRSLWQKIIHEVVANGGNIIRPWFTQLQPISLEHGLLEIETPGRKEQAYCRQHASRLFTEAAQNATGRLVGVCFLTGAQRTDTDKPFGRARTLETSLYRRTSPHHFEEIIKFCGRIGQRLPGSIAITNAVLCAQPAVRSNTTWQISR